MQLEKIKRIVEEIKSVHYEGHPLSTEYEGVKSGLDMLVRHLEKTQEETNFTPSVLTIPINYRVDDDGVKHIDYDLIREKYEEQMFKLRTLNIN